VLVNTNLENAHIRGTDFSVASIHGTRSNPNPK
jgi:hypothetical protein